MKKSKLFLAVGVVFMLVVIYAVYDMSQKTKFPKGKPAKSKLQDSTHMIIDSNAVKLKLDTLQLK